MNSDEQFARRYRALVDAAAFAADRAQVLWQRIAEALEQQTNPPTRQSCQSTPPEKGGEKL